MIQNDQEFKATLERIERFQKQVEKIREVETNPRNYELSAGGFLAEIDRMHLELVEYLSTHPSELVRPITAVDHINTEGALFNSLNWHVWPNRKKSTRKSVRIWKSFPEAFNSSVIGLTQ